MQFKDAHSVTGQQTAYEGKYASMLVPWSVVKPADMKNYSSEEFAGCADVNERNTFKTATLTIRKVDAETGEQILHDDTTFGIYAASRYDTEKEILKDAEKLSGDEKTKFVNQFKPGDTKFYLEDTKVYGSREFLEAMGAYDIDYLLTLSDHKAKRYQGNGYEDVSESKIKDILGKDGYTTKTGTVEYGIYHYDILSGTSLSDDEKVTWYYSVYNTDSPLCIGTIGDDVTIIDKNGQTHGTVASQLVAALLAVSCVTVTFCVNLTMVQDKANGARKDFNVSPISRSTIYL
mgnify:CR=1 FL=1